MIAASKVGTMTREAVGDLEQRLVAGVFTSWPALPG